MIVTVIMTNNKGVKLSLCADTDPSSLVLVLEGGGGGGSQRQESGGGVRRRALHCGIKGCSKATLSTY